VSLSICSLVTALIRLELQEQPSGQVIVDEPIDLVLATFSSLAMISSDRPIPTALNLS